VIAAYSPQAGWTYRPITRAVVGVSSSIQYRAASPPFCSAWGVATETPLGMVNCV